MDRRLWIGAALVLGTPAAVALLVVAWGGLAPSPAVWDHVRTYLLPEAWRGSLVLALGVGLGALLLGTSLAWLTATCEFPGRRHFEWALALPLALPSYVLGFTALGMLDYAGPLSTQLRDWFGPDFRLPPIRSTPGLIGVLTLALFPYVYLVARAAFLDQGRRWSEAARALGLSRRAAAWRVTLPLAAPTLAAGTLLVMMETVADFGTVAVFNQPSLTLALYRSWYGLFSMESALRIATLLATSMLLLAVVNQMLRSRAPAQGTGQAAARTPLDGGLRGAASLFAGGVLTLAFLLPVAQLLVWAAPRLGAPDAAAVQAVWHSFGLAALAALLVVAGALVLALAERRAPGALTRAASGVAGIGYALPGPVLAVALFVSLMALSGWTAAWWPIVWQGTVWVLLLGYFVRFAAVGHLPVAAGLAGLRQVHEDVARGLGVRGWALYRRVHLPMLRGVLFTALALVFVDVAKEMPMTLMLRPYGWDTLAVRIFEFTAEGDWARASVPALALVVLGLVPVALLVRGVRET